MSIESFLAPAREHVLQIGPHASPREVTGQRYLLTVALAVQTGGVYEFRSQRRQP
jgi:hypothetical protein